MTFFQVWREARPLEALLTSRPTSSALRCAMRLSIAVPE